MGLRLSKLLVNLSTCPLGFAACFSKNSSTKNIFNDR